jgi:hypothetical protein
MKQGISIKWLHGLARRIHRGIRSFTLIVLCVFSVLSVSQTVSAQSSNQFDRMVDHDRKSAQVWWYSWIGGYTVATIGQGAVNLSSDSRSLRQDMALGAATTFLGAVGTLLTPVVPGKVYIKKHGFQPGDSLESQAFQEFLLKEIASREKAGRSWKTHAVTGVVDLGSGLVTWIAFKRSVWDGVINFALNTVIAEAQIWSQPVRAVKDYEKWQEEKAGGRVQSIKKPEAAVFVGSAPGGVRIRVVF